MNNAQIAKALGITIEDLGDKPLSMLSRYHVAILRPPDMFGDIVVHSAWYTEMKYDDIITHVIAIGKLPDWESQIKKMQELLKLIPQLKDELK